MNPTPTICDYAVLRFLPQPDREEFVNVGVVVNCLQPGFLEFKTETRIPEWLNQVFPNWTKEKSERAQAAMTTELERVKKLVSQARDPMTGRRNFQELVRPRESVFRFGEIRTISSAAPEGVVDELFERYVMRSSAGKHMAS